ncbi:MAG: hypothetical protein II272_03450, partial [Oscillospiraceae bacterium]|nr:hypothetical protein [Oscillospiraceae bacterium]
ICAIANQIPEEAQEYSPEVSRLIGRAYEKHISSATLPDGRMYYNIASRLIPSTLDENYKLVSDYAAKAQQALNQKAGIGLKAQTAPRNQDRVNGLVDAVSNAEWHDDVFGWLLTAIENFSQNIVDRTIQANADFHAKAGLSPKIIRKAERKCCKWCQALAGEFDYSDLPDDIYRRHENCRCTVLYDPADGGKKLQNVHTKKWTDPGERDMIEERRKIGLGNLGIFRPREYHGTIAKYVSIPKDSVFKAAKEGKRHGGVYKDAVKKNVKQLQKSIINRTAEVEHHADKIMHPESYVSDWNTRDSRYQAGLLRKWEKDMQRNAEQATIEISVYEERFGL